MKSKNNLLIPLFSIIFSFVTFWLCLEAKETINQPMIWTGLCLSLPLLAAYLGTRFASRFCSSMHILFPSSHPLRLSLCLIVAFGLGAVGQWIYSLSWQTEAKEVQVVFLLDGSDSMMDYQEDCQEAAKTIIESLDDHYEVQVVSFASRVLGSTDFLVMDTVGKEEAISFIDSIDIVGGTDFNQVFAFAAQALEGKDNPAVIMLTDGDAPLDMTIYDTYQKQGIHVYTIRIKNDYADNSNVEQLIKLSEESGGMDTQINVASGGKADQDKILDAFDQAFASSGGLVQADRLLLEGKSPDPFVLYLTLRVVIFGLLGVVASYFHFGKQGKQLVFANFIVGGIIGIVLSAMSLTWLLLACLMSILLFGTLPSFKEVG